MAITPVPNRIFKFNVNGQTYYEVLATPNIPWGKTEVSINEVPAEKRAEIQQQMNTPSQYVYDDQGRFTTRQAVEQEMYWKNEAAAGRARAVQVGNGIAYVPIGSAADLQQQGKSYEEQLKTPSVISQIERDRLSPNAPTPPRQGRVLGASTDSTTGSGTSPASTGAASTGVGGGGSFGISGFQSFGKVPGNPTVYGQTTDGRWIAFESGEQFEAAGGDYGKIANLQAPPAGAINYSQATTGNPIYDQLYNELKGYLDELQKRGQVINPNIELTPDKIAEFTRQAESEIDPYFASQLKLAREEFLSSVGYSKEQIMQQEAQLERKYAQQVRSLGEQAAESGFALSGKRALAEKDLAQDTQFEIDSTRRTLLFNAENAARNFAKQYGTSQLPIEQIGNAPRALPGQLGFQKEGAGAQPLYQLSPDVYQGLVGEQEFQKKAAVKTRASELESAFRSQQGVDQARKLTL